jgi:hypothetical protein
MAPFQDMSHARPVQKKILVAEFESLTAPVPENRKPSATGRIVHEDRRRTSEYIVRVELVDREVVPVGRTRNRRQRDDIRVVVGGGFEGVAGLEVAGGDPGVTGLILKGMI